MCLSREFGSEAREPQDLLREKNEVKTSLKLRVMSVQVQQTLAKTSLQYCITETRLYLQTVGYSTRFRTPAPIVGQMTVQYNGCPYVRIQSSHLLPSCEITCLTTWQFMQGHQFSLASCSLMRVEPRGDTGALNQSARSHNKLQKGCPKQPHSSRICMV